MKKTDKKVKKSTRSQDEEKQKILSAADRVKGEQLTINPMNELEYKKELERFALGSVENPEKKYLVYYNGIQKLLMNHLPKGNKCKLAREYVYEEKNVYLTRGKRKNKVGIRGADGRMEYLSDAEELLKVVIDWVSKCGTASDLYNKIREMNIKKGYPKPLV